MLSIRGDAHKFYKKLFKVYSGNTSIKQLDELQEMRNIIKFYEQLDTDDLILIQYRMEKEKAGSGILPILISSLPWLLFIFSKQLQSWLLQDDSYFLLWSFIIFYIFLITISIIFHFLEKSWATVHIKIIKDLVNKRETNKMFAER